MNRLPSSGIITGAAGGIGKALTLTLAGAGVSLIANDLDPGGLDELVRETAGLPG